MQASINKGQLQALLLQQLANMNTVCTETRNVLGQYTNEYGDLCQVQLVITADDDHVIPLHNVTEMAVLVGDQVEGGNHAPAYQLALGVLTQEQLDSFAERFDAECEFNNHLQEQFFQICAQRDELAMNNQLLKTCVEMASQLLPGDGEQLAGTEQVTAFFEAERLASVTSEQVQEG